jgi:hypothetical protein
MTMIESNIEDELYGWPLYRVLVLIVRIRMNVYCRMTFGR